MNLNNGNLPLQNAAIFWAQKLAAVSVALYLISLYPIYFWIQNGENGANIAR